MAADPVAQVEASAQATADLRRSLIAIGAGWLVPGLGHLVLGKIGRAVVFAVIVWGAFGIGLAHDGRLALRDDRQPFLTSLQVIANLGVGPADLVARMVVYGEAAYRLPQDTTRSGVAMRSEVFRARARSPFSIYGTAYLWTAGLMNLLLLFDVWDIGRGRKD
jgi:TM2 domain-containing membrane protein YozV